MVMRSDAQPPAEGPGERDPRRPEARSAAQRGPASRAASGADLRLDFASHSLRLVRPEGAPFGDPSRPLSSLREALESDRVLPGRGPAHAGGFRRPIDRSNPDSAGSASHANQARRAVMQANVESAYDATLDPNDPRWLVAVETAQSLEGSLLTFERRRRILALAQRIGVRPFDANLIIAAVQDRARRGEPIASAMSTVALTAPASRRRAGPLSREALPYTATAIVAVLLHVVGAWAVVRFWLS